MDDRGPAFLAAAWLLTVIMWIVLSIRLYSRTFLTGSVGSDDFAIGIAAVNIVMIVSVSLVV